MPHQNTFWKDTALHMLLAMQGIFLATTSWDFFLTVIASDVQRTAIFAGLGASTVTFIIVPWLMAIFVLTAVLVKTIMTLHTSQPVTRINYEYGVMFVLYVLLAVLGWLNPVIPIFIVINYGVNAVWAASLIYFRFRLRQGIIAYACNRSTDKFPHSTRSTDRHADDFVE